MKAIALAFALLVFFTAAIGCGPRPGGLRAADSRPAGNIVATLDTDNYDFNAGEVAADSTIEHRFDIRNATIRTLHVRELRVSGKSATAKLEPMSLGAGDKAILTVSTPIPEGPGGASVEFVTDGGVLAPRFVLRAIGVRPRVSPTALDFGRVLAGQTKTHDLKVLYRNSIDLVPKSASEIQIHSLDKRVKVGSGGRLEPKVGVSVEGISFIERLAGWSFPVSVRCEKPEGKLETTLEVVFVNMPGTVLKVPVRAELVGAVRVVPPQVSFFLLGEKTRRDRTVQVFCDAARSLEVRQCLSGDERVEARIASRENRKTIVDVKLKADYDGEDFETQLVLTTNQPQQPEIELPVHVFRVPLAQSAAGSKLSSED